MSTIGLQNASRMLYKKANTDVLLRMYKTALQQRIRSERRHNEGTLAGQPTTSSRLKHGWSDQGERSIGKSNPITSFDFPAFRHVTVCSSFCFGRANYGWFCARPRHYCHCCPPLQHHLVCPWGPDRRPPTRRPQIVSVGRADVAHHTSRPAARYRSAERVMKGHLGVASWLAIHRCSPNSVAVPRSHWAEEHRVELKITINGWPIIKVRAYTHSNNFQLFHCIGL